MRIWSRSPRTDTPVTVTQRTAPRRTTHEAEGGFTIIELLVIMIIVAILAAIAIPTFLRQREDGWVAQIRAALRNGAISAESYRNDDRTGNFQGLDEGALAAEGFRAADIVSLEVFVSTDFEDYCLVAVHEQLPPSHAWRIATQETDGAPSESDECSFDTE